jgi:hypothetical protein
MDRVVVFIDAGYLFAQSSVALTGKKLPRSGLVLNSEKAVEAFSKLGSKLSGLPILRVYWYDGTSTGPTTQHLSLAHLSNLKLRLGFVNSVGEQKGVDSLIVTDMITLARNGAMADAVLLTGDEDIRVGVQQAQEYGVKVHLVGIKPSRGSQSLPLLQEADSTLEWGPSELEEFLSIRPVTGQEQLVPIPAATTSKQSTNDIDPLAEVAAILAGEFIESELQTLIATIRESAKTPKEIDGRLLAKSRERLGRNLDASEKAQVRKAFLKACEGRTGGSKS